MSSSEPADPARGLPAESEDERWMRTALELAAGGQGRVEPNPMVGCVIVKQGHAIGQGFHQAFGGPHAEIDALRSLESIANAAGATAYVTLEPCCHHGKTPPCSEALIEAGLARVVVAMPDPFPKVDGGGLSRLRQAGIEVQLGVCQHEAEALNAPYLKRLRTGMPWVIAKWAMTADGRIATRDGESQWITGPQSRHHVHRLRGRVDAIIAGMGTVIADDPRLDARLTSAQGDPVSPPRVATRVVICNRRLPPLQSRLMQTAREIPTWLFHSDALQQAPTLGLVELGAKVIHVSGDSLGPMIPEVLRYLGGHEMTNVMIEGGPTLLGSFLDTTTDRFLIDECHVYVGAKLFGGQASPGPIAGRGIGPITSAPQMRLQGVDRFDSDVRLIYRVTE
ncbi:bifunctional diaminohydroxyphosphoribosylaminopyrimidine deaminase/5-amino-6-(5-phosphoribosylamino)uracil reductase RibD [Roseiconus nitratireducens]|uniref:Riboflavin biosynthesis protein RibD n=1 Tax=Roseiconus nitratireducens TaxID=2605748 RepID=A0A5M6DM44_9BACT|nr:bifunctional diaminohydroxyphosphoribosylaminopyrimidine deaminase/5-amino-6-(5-phosphoribosylamino)uracil reductase RibD [Roseiconus nitratireducens]KAA5547200.1 bifunctional diaminohydroxyphosphoribosylaminopyrimidine deaminase/5-amino-6-(5-phosphoribosylamino)uracil reductase RibD [Roseiconus nitratireducens]